LPTPLTPRREKNRTIDPRDYALAPLVIDEEGAGDGYLLPLVACRRPFIGLCPTILHALAQNLLVVMQARCLFCEIFQVDTSKPRDGAASGKRERKMRRESLLDGVGKQWASSWRWARAHAAPVDPTREPRQVAARPTLRRERGFTVIELMITVVIIAILASIAYPSYQDYVRRGALTDGTTTLADARVKMEQYYQDNSSYGPGGGVCGFANPATTKYFSFSCAPAAGASPQTYTFTATGTAGLTNGFVFTINHQNVRATTGMHAAWGSLPGDAGTRWILKKP
jgi:type IV pilus assembly protein PilE